MADLAVYHPDVTRGGGAEAVCLHIIDALSQDHEVTLLTGSDPNLSTLDMRFGTDTVGTDVSLLGPVGRRASSGHRFYTMRHAICANEVRRRSDDYDGVISAYNELTVPDGALQYIHHPLFSCPDFPEQPTGHLASLMDWIARSIARYDSTSGNVITNSAWSASILETCRGVRPRVIHPPVTLEDSSGEPWANRENGFVTIGRIAQDKRTSLSVDVVERIRKQGHNVTLHVVGSPSNSKYSSKVVKRMESLDYVTYHRNLSRKKLLTLLGSTRYGIHAKPHEHFGMAVAEMVEAGMVPFVPDTGGQVEIVGRNEELTYSTLDEAVSAILRVLESKKRQKRLRDNLPDAESRFGRERFHAEIKEITDAWLEAKSGL